MKQTFKDGLDLEKNGGGMARIIAFVHHKGGTGKTTSCLNIAGWLAKVGKRVLVVDLDPQGNATAGLGIDRAMLFGSLYEVFRGERAFEEVIVQTDSGVHLAPSSFNLLSFELEMAGQAGRVGLLAERLEAIESFYDYILIDVPPGSTQLMMNGIAAAEHLIIPIDSGVFGAETLETLKKLIFSLADELGIEVNVMMVLLKSFSADVLDLSLTHEVRKMVAAFLQSSGLGTVKIFTIPFSRQIYQAQMKGLPISHWAPYSDAGRAYQRVTMGLLPSPYQDTINNLRKFVTRSFAKIK